MKHTWIYKCVYSRGKIQHLRDCFQKNSYKKSRVLLRQFASLGHSGFLFVSIYYSFTIMPPLLDQQLLGIALLIKLASLNYQLIPLQFQH